MSYEDYLYQIIGENIKTVRETEGFTQEALAEAAQMSRQYLGRIENGGAHFSMDKFIKIVRSLDIWPGGLFVDASSADARREIYEMVETCEDWEAVLMAGALRFTRRLLGEASAHAKG